MIHATPPVTSALSTRLAQLDELRTRLGLEVGRSIPWQSALRRQARIATITGSTSIEGYSVPSAEAGLLIDGARPSTDDESRAAVSSYARAMDHVAVMSDDPGFRWLDRVLLDLHFDACNFQRAKSPGRWRTGPVYVRAPDGRIEYTAPDAGVVPALMDEIVEWLETGDQDAHVAVRGAMAHLHVVSVHPFRDGNGRISRLVQSLVLAREGLLSPEFGSIEPYLAENTQAYYRQLQQAHGASYQPERDATQWVEFCVEAHIVQAQQRLTLFDAASTRWSALEQFVSQQGWPDRLVIALEQAVMGTTSRADYLNEADVATPTANSDLRRLVDAGLLLPQGSGKATRYAASPQLTALVPTTAANPAAD